jgi:hypothetical protein
MVLASGFVGEVMSDANDDDSMSGLAGDVRQSLHRFLDVYEPLRSDLYRYPLGTHTVTAAYLERLLARPSISRVIREATPYLHLFPEEAPASAPDEG